MTEQDRQKQREFAKVFRQRNPERARIQGMLDRARKSGDIAIEAYAKKRLSLVPCTKCPRCGQSRHRCHWDCPPQ